MNAIGYEVHEGFLDQATVADLRDRLQAALDAYQPNDAEQSHLDRYLLHDLVARDVAFCRLLDDERLHAMVCRYLGPFWTLYAATSSSLPPGGTNYGRRIHHDAGSVPRSYVGRMGAIFALDDFTAENGATEVLPGSHEGTGEGFEEHYRRIACSAGALILFDARLYHRAGVNRTDQWRHALTMNFCQPWMKQRLDWPRLVSPLVVEQLTPHGKRALGMDARVPANMDEFWARTFKQGQV